MSAMLFNNPLWRIRRRVIYGLLAGLVFVLLLGLKRMDWLAVVLPVYSQILEWVLPTWFALATLEDGFDKWQKREGD